MFSLFRRIANRIVLITCIMAAVVTKAAADYTPPYAEYLNRLAYGPSQQDIVSLTAMGIDPWVTAQLRPPREDARPLPPYRNDFEIIRRTAAQIYLSYGMPYQTNKDPQARTALRKEWQRLFDEQRQYRLDRAVNSPYQLEELMTEFWFNHFNVFAPKSDIMLWLPDYENNRIRPASLGRFRNLLELAVTHPAMLIYLDNTANQKDRPGKKGINENLAREILELHTLGVNGGYSQEDVVTLARILTGWTVNRSGLARGETELTVFLPHRHDNNPKTLMGVTLKRSGRDELAEALDILAAHPETARHLCTKLARFFLTDMPAAEDVDFLAREFIRSQGNIADVLAAMFKSDRFADQVHERSQFKTPYHYAISTLRAIAIGPQAYRPVLGLLNSSAQPLYQWTTPDGYPLEGSYWLTGDNLIKRIDFAIRIASLDSAPGMPPKDLVSRLASPDNQKK